MGEVDRPKAETEGAPELEAPLPASGGTPPNASLGGETVYSWFSPGTGVRSSQIELAIPSERVIAR